MFLLLFKVLCLSEATGGAGGGDGPIGRFREMRSTGCGVFLRANVGPNINISTEFSTTWKAMCN